MLTGGMVLVLTAMLPAVSAQEGELTSRRDHSLNVNRDLPILCKAGDLERRPGQSMGQVFGDAWPLQPEPSVPEGHAEAKMTGIQFDQATMRGLPSQPGLVIAAVLVDRKGKALGVEPLCATDEGYDVATKRLLMRARYRPATVDGRPIISVAMVVARYKNAIFLRDGN